MTARPWLPVARPVVPATIKQCDSLSASVAARRAHVDRACLPARTALRAGGPTRLTHHNSGGPARLVLNGQSDEDITSARVDPARIPPAQRIGGISEVSPKAANS